MSLRGVGTVYKCCFFGREYRGNLQLLQTTIKLKKNRRKNAECRLKGQNDRFGEDIQG